MQSKSRTSVRKEAQNHHQANAFAIRHGAAQRLKHFLPKRHFLFAAQVIQRAILGRFVLRGHNMGAAIFSRSTTGAGNLAVQVQSHLFLRPCSNQKSQRVVRPAQRTHAASVENLFAFYHELCRLLIHKTSQCVSRMYSVSRG